MEILMSVKNFDIINQNLEAIKCQIETQWTQIQVEKISCCPSITMEDIAPANREPKTSYPYLSLKFKTRTETPVVQSRKDALHQIRDIPLTLGIGQRLLNVIYIHDGQNRFSIDHIISTLDSCSEPKNGEPVSDYGLAIDIGFED